jgi:hypothetical protein
MRCICAIFADRSSPFASARFCARILSRGSTKLVTIRGVPRGLVFDMDSFEDVRAWAAMTYKLRHNEPFLLSFDVVVDGSGRKQGMYLAELECENGDRMLRISTPIVGMFRVNTERALRFNWAQRVGFLAAGDLDGKEWLHLCENRSYRSLSNAVLEQLIDELAPLADKLEATLSGRDHG